MQAKPRILMILASMLMLGIILLPTMVMAQGDTQPTATPIGVIGEEDDEDESSAPAAPDIAPPTVEGQELPSTTEEDTETGDADPIATEAIGEDGEETGDAIIEDIATCPVAVQDAFTATEILCTDLPSGEACIGNGTVDSVFGGDIAGLNFSQANDRV